MLINVSFQCVPAVMSAFAKTGEEQERSAKEAREHMKTLESGLNGKRYFGNEKIGFVDVAGAWIGCWGRITEEIGEVTLIDEETVPSLAAWFRNVLEDPKMKDCMPPYDKLLEHNKDFRRFLAASASAPK